MGWLAAHAHHVFELFALLFLGAGAVLIGLIQSGADPAETRVRRLRRLVLAGLVGCLVFGAAWLLA